MGAGAVVRSETIIFGMCGSEIKDGGKRLPALCLIFFLLMLLGGCATERWCNDLNDYSTLQADLQHCERKTGFAGQIWPGSFDNCMKSLGWRPCQKEPDDSNAP